MRRPSALTFVGVLVILLVFLAIHLLFLDGFVRPRLDFELWKPVLNLSLPVASQTPTAELLARPPVSEFGKIPRIFHQSWKSSELPSKFETWSTLCRQKHKDWEWILWTDKDNLRLVQTYFPWLEETYKGLPAEIYRADLARYLYMYIYGGVYADLDTECLRPTEGLEDDYNLSFDSQASNPLADTAVLGRMGIDPKFEHSIPNAWMASTPGHPFFLTFLDFFNSTVSGLKQRGRKLPLAEHVTGPAALYAAISQYHKDRKRFKSGLSYKVSQLAREGPFGHLAIRSHDLLLLPSHYIYPYSWNWDGAKMRKTCWVLSKYFSPEACKRGLEVERKRSISITYWSHTHTSSGHNKVNMKHIQADA